MDSVTHIVLGACIGEVVAGKQLGKKAMIIGAILQTLPDIDFVASYWLPTYSDLLAHRGFTHSLLFTILASVLFTLILHKFNHRTKINHLSFNKWIIFCWVELIIHVFIDCFNVYGTGLFEPFSHYRLSFNTIYVADPIFTAAPLVCTIVLLLLKKLSSIRKTIAVTSIVVCFLYLLITIFNKLYINQETEKSLRTENIVANRYFSTPTMLNCFLWYIVVEADSGFFIGYRSVFDKGKSIDFSFVYRNNSLEKLYGENLELSSLKRFAKGYFVLENKKDTLLFYDLRFGEKAGGWQENSKKFAFYYYLQYPKKNDLIIQRGRFEGWNNQMLMSFLNRIKGI